MSDALVKSQKWDGKVKSSRSVYIWGRAKSRGMQSTYSYMKFRGMKRNAARRLAAIGLFTKPSCLTIVFSDNEIIKHGRKYPMALENDLVLIYHEENPMVFGRIESITADHKKDWYQVRLFILSVPLQAVTWILKEDYINGAEFTMEGRKMRLEKVACPPESPPPPADPEDGPETSGGREKAQVITFPEKK